MSGTDRSEEYGLVVSVRKYANEVNKNISENSKRDYLTKYERMKRTDSTPETAGTKKAYYAYRAALLYGTALEVASALRLRDKSEYGSNEWQAAMATIKRCAAIFERYPPDPQRTHREQGSPSFTWQAVADYKARTETGWSPCVRSKKRVLAKLKKFPDWHAKLFEKITPTHKNAAAICALTGARPSEIARGVTVQITGTQQHPTLTIQIRGSKLTAYSGQPERTLRIRIDRAEAAHLFAQCRQQGALAITTHPANLTAAVIKAGKKAFPNLGMSVSPYVFRHSVSAELKAAGVSEENIAQALGHQATKSQQAYGLPVHATGHVSITAVVAATPVRSTHRHPSEYLRSPFATHANGYRS